MVDIPDSLRTVFSAPVREQNESYVIEVPSRTIEHETVSVGDTYRIAILEADTAPATPDQDSPRSDQAQSRDDREPPEPPVDEGERREVTIEAVGDKGDGIAKVERGYVVIVPDTRPGQQPTIEIDQVRENVAFATVVDQAAE